MNAETPRFSAGFEELYCDKSVYEPFSEIHPVSFARVLPFQAEDAVKDDGDLIYAERMYLANRNNDFRGNVIDGYARCGLLPEADAANVKSISDAYDADFFELMGEVYSNASMHICALRWYREYIRELEAHVVSSDHPAVYLRWLLPKLQRSAAQDISSDCPAVYASVGYSLYSLGLYAEAILWSKSCVGPHQTGDVVSRALINHEAQLAGGGIRGIERAGGRTRYTVIAPVPPNRDQTVSQLNDAIKTFAPFEEVYIDWIAPGGYSPEIQLGGYPFQAERDGGSLIRHKMNLIFATCGQADALLAGGHPAEARRLLTEAAMVEPEAGIILDRLKGLS